VASQMRLVTLCEVGSEIGMVGGLIRIAALGEEAVVASPGCHFDTCGIDHLDLLPASSREVSGVIDAERQSG
jgi:hypothetical protein